MIQFLFAAETADSSPLKALGVDGRSLVFQFITFVLVFLILKKFAFKPITKMLAERRRVIADGILLGEQMEKEKANLDAKADTVIREARHQADKIVAIAHKETRELIQTAEKDAKAKVDAIMKDADAKISEDAEQARRSLEKDIVGLVSEATDAVVHEKVDSKKDAEIVAETLKGHKK